MPLQSKLFQDH